MLHSFLIGVLLGWGAAIPIGPINIEVIRRNLLLGSPSGIIFGLGACSADITFIILLSLGALLILTHIIVLKIISIIGALILAWFGISALRLSAKTSGEITITPSPLWKQYLAGYSLTLVNPLTILFWASVSSQIAVLTHDIQHAAPFAVLGVMIGTVSWIIGLNIFLHSTRHFLSKKLMRYLNITGGIILLGFAVFILIHAFTLS